MGVFHGMGIAMGLSLLGILSGVMFQVINTAQPEAYMDEIFHVPQTQLFCQGNFSYWDPMITTLPGTYLGATAMVKSVSAAFTALSAAPLRCHTIWLRATNLFYAAGNALVLWGILRRLHPTKGKDRLALDATVLAMFPTLFFFYFLYYTDAGSTFFVLLAYWLSLCDAMALSALVSFVAVVFRQTNAVWTLFVAGEAAVRLLRRIGTLPKDKSDSHLLGATVWFCKEALANWLELLALTGFHAAVVTGFAAFVIANGGIVVGDRHSHMSVLHVPQLFYFVAFAAAFSFMHLVDSKVFFHLISAALTVKAVVITGLMAMAVYHCTHEHPYLLADNRHFPFYVWKNIYRRHKLARYAVIPGYATALWLWVRQLRKTMHPVTLLGLAIAAAIALVPAKLLEPRYFIIPFLLCRLHLPLPSTAAVALEGALYLAVNVATAALFVLKPFPWPNGTQQRFMW